jgi:type II secretory pathway pseudopilin PulG
VSSVGGRTPAGRRALRGLPAGASLVEITIVLAVMSLVATMSTPILASAMDAGRARQAAQYLAAQCRHARMHAISSSANVGLVFDRVGSRWRVRRCVDGNGNGVRRTDIANGKDSCPEGAVELGELFGGVAIDVDAALPDPDGGAGTSDPVRFGSSDLASFTPTGTATAGTVYVRSTGGAQYAVRVAGVTGRTRVLRFDTGARRWMEA